MISMTENAKAQIDEYFAQNEVSPLRIFVAESCGGPALGLGLDEEREGDEVVDLQGYTVVINKGLLNTAKPIAIDFTERGFSLDSSMKFEKPEGGGCSGCAGC